MISKPETKSPRPDFNNDQALFQTLTIDELQGLFIAIQHHLSQINETTEDSFSRFNKRLQNNYTGVHSLVANLAKIESIILKMTQSQILSDLRKHKQQLEETACALKEATSNSHPFLSKCIEELEALTLSISKISEESGDIKIMLSQIYKNELMGRNNHDAEIITTCLKARNYVSNLEQSTEELKTLLNMVDSNARLVIPYFIDDQKYTELLKGLLNLSVIISKIEKHIQVHLPEIKKHAKETLSKLDGVIKCLQYQDIISQKVNHAFELIGTITIELANSSNEVKRQGKTKYNGKTLLILPEITELLIRELLLAKIEYQKIITEIQQNFAPMSDYKQKAERINMLMQDKVDLLWDKISSALQVLGNFDDSLTKYDQSPDSDLKKQKSFDQINESIFNLDESLENVQKCIFEIRGNRPQDTEFNGQIESTSVELKQLMHKLKTYATQNNHNNNTGQLIAEFQGLNEQLSEGIRNVWSVSNDLEQNYKEATTLLQQNDELIADLTLDSQDCVFFMRSQHNFEAELDDVISLLEIVSRLTVPVDHHQKIEKLMALESTYTMASQRNIHDSYLDEKFGNNHRNNTSLKTAVTKKVEFF
ncbi:MAG: hypothetical protein ACFCUU_03665 [Cyclobacteriaceae bacterium]